jgi:hypothetical protein
MGDWTTAQGLVNSLVQGASSVAQTVQTGTQPGTSPDVQFQVQTNWGTVIVFAVLAWIILSVVGKRG